MSWLGKVFWHEGQIEFRQEHLPSVVRDTPLQPYRPNCVCLETNIYKCSHGNLDSLTLGGNLNSSTGAIFFLGGITEVVRRKGGVSSTKVFSFNCLIKQALLSTTEKNKLYVVKEKLSFLISYLNRNMSSPFKGGGLENFCALFLAYNPQVG